ncbi:MAG: hypothetical protein H0X73_06085 [Chthoniobacterales bacterium]|nr:hypothetical protein [Chthoniobacterales bacterium]
MASTLLNEAAVARSIALPGNIAVGAFFTRQVCSSAALVPLYLSHRLFYDVSMKYGNIDMFR